MWALAVDREGFRVVEREDPIATDDEALVRVRLAGVCNTDLEIIRGYLGFEGILGHELVGEVIAAEDTAWVGKRVCADINVACGRCSTCLAGDPHHCPARTVIGIVGRDGAFAERIVVPLRNLYEVPDGVEDECAVFTEPLAAAFEILEQVTLRATDRVLVLGDGKLGLLCALVLVATGADVCVLGRHVDKLRIAAQAGARVTTEPGESGFDVVVEATGSPSGLVAALDAVRPRGTIVLKSTFAERPMVDTNRLVIDEIRLVGSRCGPFAKALAALAEGVIDPRPLIQACYPLADAERAVRQAATHGTLKVLIRP